MDFVSKGMKNFQYRLSKIEILSLEKLGEKQRHTHTLTKLIHTLLCVVPVLHGLVTVTLQLLAQSPSLHGS